MEHLLLQSAHPAAANQYENVVYCCKRCNLDRGTKSRIDSMKGQLLDPTKDAWGLHFYLEGERIQPRPGDRDASYTGDAYKMNARKKREARRIRARQIRATLERLRFKRESESTLVRLARREVDDDARRELLRVASELRRDRKTIIDEFVRTYRAIPVDAPDACRCPGSPPLGLPAWMATCCAPAPTL